MHFAVRIVLLAAGFRHIAAQCPYGYGGVVEVDARLRKRADGASPAPVPIDTEQFLALHTVNDTDGDYLTSDVGGPIEDQNSLKAGERGPTLLEDFIFRQKIMHFDHERVR